MTHFYAVSTFFNQLNYMETVFCFHNFGNFFGICQVKSNSCKFRNQLATSHKIHFSTLTRRDRVFRIQTSQCWKLSFSRINTFCKITQASFYSFYLFLGYFRFLSNYLHFNLCRNIRDTIRWQITKITSYLSRSNFYITNDLSFHFIGDHLITYLFTPLLSQLSGCLIQIFFQFFFWTYLLNIKVHLSIDLLQDIGLRNFYTVNHGLM